MSLQRWRKRWQSQYWCHVKVGKLFNWKNDLKTPAQAAAEAKGERDRIFAHCYGLYDAHLKACNVLDFDDLILLPTLLLQRNEEA